MSYVEQDPKEKLLFLINEIKKTYDELVKLPFFLKYDGTTYPLILKSWAEVKKTFRSIKNEIKKLDLSFLEQRGLIGFQLDFKIDIFNKINSYLKESIREFRLYAKIQTLPNKIKRLEKTVNIFNNLCDVVDALFKSLALPIADMFEEFKEFFKANLNIGLIELTDPNYPLQ